MPERTLLPELTRSLRALGGDATEAAALAHQAVIAPLLDARTAAHDADESGVLDAFQGASLAKVIAEATFEAAKHGSNTTAQARSRVARAEDSIEPVVAALRTLDELAPAARREGGDSSAWEQWVDQLRVVFSAADRACGQVASLISEQEPPVERRWRGLRPT